MVLVVGVSVELVLVEVLLVYSEDEGLVVFLLLVVLLELVVFEVSEVGVVEEVLVAVLFSPLELLLVVLLVDCIV